MPITFLPIADLLIGTDPPVTWLIPDFIPAGSLIALAGEPGAGKSFLAYTLALGLATGTTTLDWPLTPRCVLYFDQENSKPDATQYLRWAWIGLGCPDLALLTKNLHVGPYLVGTSIWPTTMQTAILQVQPDLIIIDTATPCLAIKDENDNGEATSVISILRSLQALMPANPPAMLILKHAKVRNDNGQYTLRGAKAWEGAVDSIVYQIKQKGRPRADGLNNTHLEPAKTRAFGLRDPIHINPRWNGEKTGLSLNRLPGK